MRRIDTEVLATMVAIVDAGGFSAAAQRLGKTQAAVSAHIARFERQLGKKLFDRTRRGVHLTEAGQTLIFYARRMLVIEDEALAALQVDQVAGRVRVGMPDDYLNVFGRPLIENFSRVNRRAQIEILCNFSVELEQLLDRGELDVAIITRGADHSAGELLAHEQLVWCSAADRFPERETPLPLALFPERLCRARPLILHALNQAGKPWRIVWTSSHLSSIQTAVDLGAAVTALPASVVPAGYRRLGRADGLPELQPVELALLVQQGARAAARQLAGFLRQLAAVRNQAVSAIDSAAPANMPASSDTTASS
jgi:DNA-binding transcriptional LysR family regulator